MHTKLFVLFLSLCLGISDSISGLFPTGNPSDILILVNKDHRIPSDYVPELVLPNVPPASLDKAASIYLRPEAAAALEVLFSAAKSEGYNLYAVSGYRSYATQSSIYKRKVAERGINQNTSAPPGASEHQLGLAMDINGDTTLKSGLTSEFGNSPEGKWVTQHAHLYGFIIRYPEDKTMITGYAYEPWHLRYLGIETASEVYDLGVTYEEYCQVLQKERILNRGEGF